MKNLCVNMIVRDESAVIERCLRSVLPLVDSWCIVDTGSKDDTMNIIRRVMKGLPGKLYKRKWKNFGHNKTEALRLAREHARYALLMDADDVLEVSLKKLPKLTADEYWLTVKYDSLEYDRPHIVRTSKPYAYLEPVHEYLHCPGSPTKGKLPGFVYRVVGGGARSKDPKKFLRDVDILKDDLKEHPYNLRSMFYLGQSYRDYGNHEEARRWYLTRALHDGWAEEKFVALLEAAKSTEHLCIAQMARPDEVVTAYLNAWEYRPTRAEPLYWLARYLRLNDRRALAFEMACLATGIQKPDDVLFVENDVYVWKARDECAISAYYVGRKELGVTMCKTLLETEDIPIDQLTHVEEVLAWNRR